MKIAALSLACLSAIALSGCDNVPGRPKKEDRRPEPHHVTDFKTLYSQNCAGCHGNGQSVGPVISMNDPLYLSILPKEQMRQIVTNGRAENGMPAFSLANGGSLTNEQIGIIVDNIYAWAKNPPPANAPAYSAPLGDVARGAAVFAANCASCHGADGKGLKDKAGSVINPAYLGLVSDQYLRTITIAGRNDLGCPDFANRVPGKAMTSEEISDVVAWLASHRENEFGQKLAPAQQ